MLKKSAYEHFVAIRDCSAVEERGVTCGPEAVQYLLRSHATTQAIPDDLHLAPAEDERAYADRVKQSFRRCRGVHRVDDHRALREMATL